MYEKNQSSASPHRLCAVSYRVCGTIQSAKRVSGLRPGPKALEPLRSKAQTFIGPIEELRLLR